jgi:hypothetical protein
MFDAEEYAENWCRACQRKQCLGHEHCPEMQHAWDIRPDEPPDETGEPVEVCGLCGKILNVHCCCEWGLPTRPVWIETKDGKYGDWVTCPASIGQVKSCGACRYGYNDQGICTEDDGPLADQTDDTIGSNGQYVC